jgi:ribosome-associated protein
MTAPDEDRPAHGRLEAVAVDLPITLGQFVKLAGFAATGGEAKQLVTTAQIHVNGGIETRRGRRLAFGDVVETRERSAEVIRRPAPPSLSRG